MSRILVIDDEESICWGLKRLLADEGHDVRACASAEEGLESLARDKHDAVILDVRLPRMSGLDAIEKIRRVAGHIPIVVMTAYGTLDTAVAAIEQGAIEYVAKPFQVDQMTALVRRALARSQEVSRTRQPAMEDQPPAAVLLGRAAAMQDVFKQIALVAPTDATVLVTGESGTGKELVARAIHAHSRRREGPFVPVHMAALSSALVESELFGHARGAFTGAAAARLGLLELAGGGTLFLDEVGDIPLESQVKLLRVLEQREVTPVGESRARPVDFRVLAATHRDLRREVEEGRFRADLYFRLVVYELRLPPLRERGDDVELLAERFLAEINTGSPTSQSFSREALDELRTRHWSGNVRELRNAVHRAAIAARGGRIDRDHLPAVVNFMPLSSAARSLPQLVRTWIAEKLDRGESTGELYESFLREAEEPLFSMVIEHCKGNRQAAAAALGIHRATLRKRLADPAARETPLD